MPEIRFMQTAWRVSAGFLSFARAGTGLLLMGMVLGYGIPGWAFDGFKKVPKSKPAVIHIRLEATAEKEIVRPGETFLIFVVVYLDEGWHMYSLEKQTEDETVATRILLDPPAFPPASEWRESKPVLARDEVLSKILKTHSGRVEFTRRFSVPPDTPPGTYPLTGRLRFRTCDNRICTLPREETFRTRVIVKADENG